MSQDVKLLPLFLELQGHPRVGIIKDYARANMEPLIEQLSDTARALAAHTEVANHCKAESDQLRVENERLRRDAERYRYLRRPEAWKENYITERGASAIFIGDGRRAEPKDGEALDAAIDRILAGQQP